MKHKARQSNDSRIESAAKLIEIETGLKMTICELKSEDLSFVFVEFEFFFGSFSGFEFLVVGGAGSSDRGPDAAVGSGGGVDIVGVDVGVEALEEENGDLEEGERESEKESES